MVGVADFPLHAGIEQLLLSLGQLEQGYLKGKKDDLAFLREMLTTPEFKSLIQVSKEELKI